MTPARLFIAPQRWRELYRAAVAAGRGDVICPDQERLAAPDGLVALTLPELVRRRRRSGPAAVPEGSRGVKVRVLPGWKVLRGVHEYGPGQEVTINAALARQLIEEGSVVVVG